MPNPTPPKKKIMERYVTAVTSFLFEERGLAPNNGVRVGLVLEAGLFVSFIYSQNPKFRDRVFEYSTLTQVAGDVSCRHRLIEPKFRWSDLRVLDLGPVCTETMLCLRET